MRATERTVDPALVRDAFAIAAAVGVIGLSFGAIAIASGLPAWAAIAMSVLVFAGGAQFMAVGVLSAGNPVAAVLAGLLLNARHLPFGMAVADAVGSGRAAQFIGSHLLVDEAVAFAMAESEPARRRAAYWLTGSMLFVLWQIGTVLGVLLGSAAGDPATLGLDAAFPAGLLALTLPSLRDRQTRHAALAGGAIAVVTTLFLPAGLPILLALLGLVLAVRPTRLKQPC